MNHFFDFSYWQGIGSNAGYGIICYLANKLRVFLLNRKPTQSSYWDSGYLLLLLAVWLSINLFFISEKVPVLEMSIVLVASTGVISIFTWRLVSGLRIFHSIGLIKGDISIANGLSYNDSLKLCHNQLDFLGIGAAKLTGSPEFENALQRCHRDNLPVRFLLASPDSALLSVAAQRKGVETSAYRDKVINSLRTISNFKIKRNFNIEVRFYPSISEEDLPIFRLMFLNNLICLVSYNVLGEGDGSQLPQLHLYRPERERDINSFYYPFRLHFDRLWSESPAWNFTDYLS